MDEHHVCFVKVMFTLYTALDRSSERIGNILTRFTPARFPISVLTSISSTGLLALSNKSDK